MTLLALCHKKHTNVLLLIGFQKAKVKKNTSST
jgi:hypothetical protein